MGTRSGSSKLNAFLTLSREVMTPTLEFLQQFGVGIQPILFEKACFNPSSWMEATSTRSIKPGHSSAGIITVSGKVAMISVKLLMHERRDLLQGLSSSLLGLFAVRWVAATLFNAEYAIENETQAYVGSPAVPLVEGQGDTVAPIYLSKQPGIEGGKNVAAKHSGIPHAVENLRFFPVFLHTHIEQFVVASLQC